MSFSSSNLALGSNLARFRICKIRKDGRNEVVIDLHQGRLTVVRDGVVLAKRYDLDCSSIGGLRVCASGAGKELIETGGIQCLVNENKPRETQ